VVQLRLTPEGKVTDISVVEKSGYEILDEAAVKMIRKASPLPLPPEGLRGRDQTVLVPIKFRLDPEFLYLRPWSQTRIRPPATFCTRRWKPHHHGFLNVGGGHRIHFEQSGNPDGFPVLFIHGGPGSRSRPDHRRFFDAAFYRIVLFDQRGCGQSTPAGSLVEKHHFAPGGRYRETAPAHRRGSMADFRRLMGSTLGLAYAIGAMQIGVAGMVLRGVFLVVPPKSMYLSGIRRFIPRLG